MFLFDLQTGTYASIVVLAQLLLKALTSCKEHPLRCRIRDIDLKQKDSALGNRHRAYTLYFGQFVS